MTNDEQTHPHEHAHEHEDGSYGMSLGVRILEDDGKLYLAEVEITPYMDEPEALGATLIFHPLDGIDPTTVDEETEWPAWPVDVDDDLDRATDAPIREQFLAIARQMGRLSESQLRDYLEVARDEAEEDASLE